MKKILSFAFILLLLLSSSAFASVKLIARMGYLTRLNTTEDDFKRIIETSERTAGWSIFTTNHDASVVKFYDSLMAMQMALNAFEIDEMALPEMTAAYIVNMNPEYEICCASRSRLPMSLAFGFRSDSQELVDKFNKAIQEMNEDFTLANLESQYIFDYDTFTPVAIEKFPGAETVKVAITGDMPPIDFVAPDGTPAGFNTALLAEIGRRLKMNIEIVQVDAGSRTAALTSGRVDVVFWYETSQKFNYNADAPEGVLLSEPYYNWNTFLHVRKK